MRAMNENRNLISMRQRRLLNELNREIALEILSALKPVGKLA